MLAIMLAKRHRVILRRRIKIPRLPMPFLRETEISEIFRVFLILRHRLICSSMGSAAGKHVMPPCTSGTSLRCAPAEAGLGRPTGVRPLQATLEGRLPEISTLAPKHGLCHRRRRHGLFSHERARHCWNPSEPCSSGNCVQQPYRARRDIQTSAHARHDPSGGRIPHTGVPASRDCLGPSAQQGCRPVV